MTRAYHDNVTWVIAKLALSAFAEITIVRQDASRRGTRSFGHFVHPMASNTASTSQNNALSDCTNLALEPTPGFFGVPSPLGCALVKRTRVNKDEGARPKRIKYTISESLPEEKCEAELEEDDPVAFFAARRTRTFFHSRQALAMSRPGITCRSFPCRSRFLSVTVRS